MFLQWYTEKSHLFFPAAYYSIIHLYHTLFNQPLLVDIWTVSLLFLLHMDFTCVIMYGSEFVKSKGIFICNLIDIVLLSSLGVVPVYFTQEMHGAPISSQSY